MKSHYQEQIPAVIQKWYRQYHRKLPWRKTRNPYRIWISEIMLQQTQVETVIPYYQRFLRRFPTVFSLADASLEEVLKAWENLGYYSRARNLHQTAKKIAREKGGEIPETREELLALPGIGPYTAAAILSFAYLQPVAAVDGNIKRILTRLFLIKEPLEKSGTKKKIDRLALNLAARGDSAGFNQGLMDLGTAVCRPRNPLCNSCPLNALCQAYQKGLQEKIPIRSAKGPLPHKDFTAGFIQDEQGRLLIVRRPASGLLGGLWKLPGGERKGKAALKRSLASIIDSELGLTVRVEKSLASIRHTYTHFHITLHAFYCLCLSEGQRTSGRNDRRWCPIQDLVNYPFSKADRKIIERVLMRNDKGEERNQNPMIL